MFSVHEFCEESIILRIEDVEIPYYPNGMIVSVTPLRIYSVQDFNAGEIPLKKWYKGLWRIEIMVF